MLLRPNDSKVATSAMVGATMTQVQGMKNAAEASASGTQSGAYNAAAKSAEQTANIETATGLINTGFGAALVTMAVQHNQNAKKAAAAAKSRVTVDQATGRVVPSAGGDAALQGQLNDRSTWVGDPRSNQRQDATSSIDDSRMAATARVQKGDQGGASKGRASLQDMATSLDADSFGKLDPTLMNSTNPADVARRQAAIQEIGRAHV